MRHMKHVVGGDCLISAIHVCVSVYSYLPPPDEKSNSHGEQHDESSHGHDNNDYHWVLFTGGQCHWKGQNTD